MKLYYTVKLTDSIMSCLAFNTLHRATLLGIKQHYSSNYPIGRRIGTPSHRQTDTHTRTALYCTRTNLFVQYKAVAIRNNCYYDSLTFDNTSCQCTQNHMQSASSLMDVHVRHNIYVNYTMYCIHISIIVYDSHVGQCLDAH